MDNLDKTPRLLMCISLVLMIIFVIFLTYKIWFMKKDKLEGKYVHTSATTFPLLDGSIISMQFKGGYLSGHVGCNVIRGLYEIRNDTLIVGPLSMTKKDCPEEIAFQDYELLKFLTEKPLIDCNKDGVTLTCKDGIIIDLIRL